MFERRKYEVWVYLLDSDAEMHKVHDTEVQRFWNAVDVASHFHTKNYSKQNPLTIQCNFLSIAKYLIQNSGENTNPN